MTFEYQNFLAHYGIKGQKWGIRRYQNEDGSLTEAGRQRYSYGNVDINPDGDGYYLVGRRGNTNDQKLRIKSDVLRQYEQKVQDATMASIAEMFGVSTKTITDLTNSDTELAKYVNDFIDENMEASLNMILMNANKS